MPRANAVLREMVVIIRPSFMKFCDQDACRAALFNHLLYWIAQKAKGQEERRVKSGEVYWFGSIEQDIHQGLAGAWGISKIKQELRALVGAGLIGQRHHPVNAWDRTYCYFIGEDQGKAIKQACTQHAVCLDALDLKNEVLHLLKITGALGESHQCKSQMQPMDQVNLTDASVESNQAIPKDSPKITAKKTPKRESDVRREDSTPVAALGLTVSSKSVEGSRVISAPEITQEQRVYASRPEKQAPVSQPVATSPTTEDTGDKESDQRKQNSTAGQSSDKPKTSEKPKPSRSKSTTPSPGASLLLDAWDETNGRPLTRTKEQVETAEELARINATGDDLRNVRERLLSQKDGFWRGRGVSLKNVANNFHLAILGPVPPSERSRANASPPTQPAAPSNPSAAPVDKSSPRKLLRRVPSATQVKLPDKSLLQEVRAAQ